LKKVGRGSCHNLSLSWYFPNLHALGYLNSVTVVFASTFGSTSPSARCGTYLINLTNGQSSHPEKVKTSIGSNPSHPRTTFTQLKQVSKETKIVIGLVIGSSVIIRTGVGQCLKCSISHNGAQDWQGKKISHKVSTKIEWYSLFEYFFWKIIHYSNKFWPNIRIIY
jgi:hypothetical protein